MKISKLKKLLALAAVTLVTSSAFFSSGASAEWKKDSNGWWNTEGNSYSIGWRSIDGAWYYFDSTGYMKTGWVKDGSTWYYMEPSGAMKTGWVLDTNTWYYLDASGAMKTGLVQVNDKTYYLSESGAMKTGNITINGVNYTFAASGEKVNLPSATQNTTDTNAAVTDSTTTSTTGSSGGSGGGSSSSAKTSYYKDLYGTWAIKDRIPSNMTSSLKDTLIDLAVATGEKATVSSNGISSSLLNVSNPTIKEGTMTASDFSNKYNDTLNNLGISGNSVKYVTVTQPGTPDNTATILIANNGKTYAVARGTVLEIEKTN